MNNLPILCPGWVWAPQVPCIVHTLCRVRRPRGLKGNLVPASSRCSLVVVPGQGVQLGHWPKDLDTCLDGKVPEEKGTVSVCPQGWDKGVRGILKQRDP